MAPGLSSAAATSKVGPQAPPFVEGAPALYARLGRGFPRQGPASNRSLVEKDTLLAGVTEAFPTEIQNVTPGWPDQNCFQRMPNRSMHEMRDAPGTSPRRVDTRSASETQPGWNMIGYTTVTIPPSG